jgi:FtsP/CotA-like multicopper oxidase with cupredoxin domain
MKPINTLDINGKAAKVFGLVGPDSKQGLGFDAGDTFDVSFVNALDEPTLIHWHGLRPPGTDDGGPDNPGRWPLHCHHLYHMATGMMTFVTYDTFG